MTLLVNDLPFILSALVGKTARSCRGLVVEGNVPNEGYHPIFRIDEVHYDAYNDSQDVMMDFTDGEIYVFVRLTTLGTREHPEGHQDNVKLGATRSETWELWFIAYGNAPEDWNIHIPMRAGHGPNDFNSMVYPAINAPAKD